MGKAACGGNRKRVGPGDRSKPIKENNSNLNPMQIYN